MKHLILLIGLVLGLSAFAFAGHVPIVNVAGCAPGIYWQAYEPDTVDYCCPQGEVCPEARTLLITKVDKDITIVEVFLFPKRFAIFSQDTFKINK